MPFLVFLVFFGHISNGLRNPRHHARALSGFSSPLLPPQLAKQRSEATHPLASFCLPWADGSYWRCLFPKRDIIIAARGIRPQQGLHFALHRYGMCT